MCTCVCVCVCGNKGKKGRGGVSQLDSYINIGEITRDKLKEIQSEISLVWRETRTHIYRKSGAEVKTQRVSKL